MSPIESVWSGRPSRWTRCTLSIAIGLVSALGGITIAYARQGPPDVPVPPQPSETFVKMTEAELLAKLPERERSLVEAVRDPRGRFDKLLDVSDMRLAALGVELDRGSDSVRDALLLYDATLRIAERRLRAPETKAAPRDKLYKRFERRLAKQKPVLRSIVDDLRPDDALTGQSVWISVEAIRIRALNSALDAEVLESPKEP